MTKNPNKKLTLEPINEFVIIRPIEEEKTHAGILLCKNKYEKPLKGIVLAVGKGKLKEDGTREEVPVKVGETVYYNPHQGAEFDIDGGILIMKMDLLIAKNV